MKVLPNLQSGVTQLLDEFSDKVGPSLSAPGSTGHPWVRTPRRVQHDLTGQRFGRLVGVRYSHRNNRGIFWEFRCDCGNSHTVVVYAVLKGTTRSCGCLRHQGLLWTDKLARLMVGASKSDLAAGVEMMTQELNRR